jgi:phosphopantothenoylcysteine synthetase/decarboxylase
MNKINVVITSGGTSEYIDDVRVLSNISSGRLGANIANNFIKHGHEVTYISPKNAVMPHSGHTGQYSFRPVKDTADVMEVMKELVPKAHVVIQAMAVSDFTFDLKEATKLSSGDPEAFIEHMRATIRKTPKVISNFRMWNPSAVLVGFKFTVGKRPKELHEIAVDLMKTNGLDMVFANDKILMQKYKFRLKLNQPGKTKVVSAERF